MTKYSLVIPLIFVLLFAACPAPQAETPVSSAYVSSAENSPSPTSAPTAPAVLLYQGQASLHIVTGEGKVMV